MNRLIYVLILIAILSCQNANDGKNELQLEVTSNIIGDTSLLYLTIEVDSAVIREYPTDGEVISKLPVNTVCKVIKKDKEELVRGKLDNWYKIEINGQVGWVFGGITSLKRKEISYSIPQKIDVSSVFRKNIFSRNCLVEEFYPIGWSEDEDYFAYIIEIQNEAKGGYGFKICVQNVVNDIVVWNWVNQRDYRDENIVSIWNDNNNFFYQSLNRYKIKQNSGLIGFKEFPARINNKTYTIDHDHYWRTSRMYGGRELRSEIVLFHAEDYGVKQILDRRYKDFDGVRNSYVYGIIPSPNNKRSVLIKLTEKNGWEGPPNVLTPELIGGHLTKGFL